MFLSERIPISINANVDVENISKSSVLITQGVFPDTFTLIKSDLEVHNGHSPMKKGYTSLSRSPR